MPTFDIVFEGGGAKGIAFAGALEVLVKREYPFRRLVGTSAGAITAALVAAGYSPQELRAAVMEEKDGKPRFAAFMDVPGGFSDDDIARSAFLEPLANTAPAEEEGRNWLDLMKDVAGDMLDAASVGSRVLRKMLVHDKGRQIFSFIERGGFFAGDAFVAWLQERLDAKGFGRDVTLATFHREFLQEQERDLSVVASDTTDNEMLVLNHRTAPDVPVAWAVRMSMSIPLVWQEVIWEEAWGTYKGVSKRGNAIVDGGLLSNFPMALISNSSKARRESKEIMGEEMKDSAQTLGLLLDETLPVPKRQEEGTFEGPTRSSLLTGTRTAERLSRLLDTLLTTRDKLAVQNYAKSVCKLPAEHIRTMEFDLQGARLENFIAAGREAMEEHLAGRGL